MELGIHGVVSFSTARRRREFGIRMALGAEGSAVLGVALKSALLPCLLGLAGGLGAAWLGIRFARTLLFGVDALEPWVALLALATMASVALAAVLFPARAAAGLDPAEVLKGE